MSLNARMSETDPRLYNPARDVAHNFGEIATEVAGRIEDERWAEVTKYLKERGVTQDQLGEACKAACLFVATSVDGKKATMAEALDRCGWFAVPEPALVAYCAYLGTVTLGVHFAGVRETTMGGVGPCLTYKDLAEVGRQAHAAMLMPRWKRKLLKLKARVKDVINAIRGQAAPRSTHNAEGS